MRTAITVTSLILLLIGIIIVITNPDRIITITFGMVFVAAGIIILTILVNLPLRPAKIRKIKKKRKVRR